MRSGTIMGGLMGALLPVRHAGHVPAFLGPREGKKKRFPSDHHPCHSPQHPQPICYDWMDAMLHTEVCWGTVSLFFFGFCCKLQEKLTHLKRFHRISAGRFDRLRGAGWSGKLIRFVPVLVNVDTAIS
jgi:hypothetical protein